MIKKGTLYWITGLSGAGKTTIGIQLYYRLKDAGSNIVILDGDVIKKIVGKTVGYSKRDRLDRAYQYCHLCELLTNQGIDVVMCTIAMFSEVREWNRNNISRYIEIYLDVDREVLEKRNKKGLYAGNMMDVPGRSLEVEFPEQPDIVIKNNGDISVSRCVDMILDVNAKENCISIDDSAYWNNYYKKNGSYKPNPSLFADFVYQQYIKNCPGSVLELGCGDGRDLLFFASTPGVKVVGIDSSDEAVRNINKLNLSNVYVACDDFVNSKTIFQGDYDYIYSRFTLHSISQRDQNRLIKNAYDGLKDGGLLLIEARSVNDEIFGKGKKIGEDTYLYENHIRRFINKEELKRNLEEEGFVLEILDENDSFAPYGNSRPMVIRAVARK